MTVEDLFPGEPRPVPAATSNVGWAVLLGADEPAPEPPPVRHAAGYAPFVAFASEAGTDPVALAADVRAFGRFVHGDAVALSDPVLADAAAVFLGNLLNAVHPASTWQRTQDRSVGSGPYSFDVDRVVAAFRDDRARVEELAAMVDRWDGADREQAAAEAAQDASMQRLEAVGLAPSEFEMPEDPGIRSVDDAGEPIVYGERWPDEPPDDAYSRVSHPERFAVLHTVARSLVTHLERHHDVEVVRSASAKDEPVIDLRPAAGAPVRLTLTAFPGVLLRAGLLWAETFPPCGCDACDDAGRDQAEQLATAVLAVAAGGLLEEDLGTADEPVWFAALKHRDGSASGTRTPPDAADRLVDTSTLRALGGGPWPAWPRRP